MPPQTKPSNAVIRWTLVDSAEIPGGGKMRLKERNGEFAITLGATPLMNSRGTGSEEALATLACDRIRDRKRPHILIGGLGMGFTLRAAAAVLGADARITVAELVPAVVAWGRGPLAGLFKDCLDDPRVDVHEGDVGNLIRLSGSTYDAILLDVDNGPKGLTSKLNDRLYDELGLTAARSALKPGGPRISLQPDFDPSRRRTKRYLDRCSGRRVTPRADAPRPPSIKAVRPQQMICANVRFESEAGIWANFANVCFAISGLRTARDAKRGKFCCRSVSAAGRGSRCRILPLGEPLRGWLHQRRMTRSSTSRRHQFENNAG